MARSRTTLRVLGCAAGVVLLVSQIPAVGGAQASDVKADYDRATSLSQRVQNKVIGIVEGPVWIEGSPKFWYRKTVKGGGEFVLVDPAAATKAPAFDHAKLAAALAPVSGGKPTPVNLGFTTFTFVNNMQAIEFTTGGGGGGGRAGGGGRGAGAPGQGPAAGANRFRCTITTYECSRLPAAAEAGQAGGGQAGQGRGGRQGGGGAGAAQGPGGQAAPPVRTSPDKKFEALIQNYNIYLRPVGGRPDQAVALSHDGSEGNAYTFGSMQWSPDGSRIAAFRRRPGYNRIVTFVRSSPTDQLQPRTETINYRKPGDVTDFDQPVLFDVASKKQTIVDTALFPNPYNNSRLEWKRDSSGFTFEYNQRGHQVYRIIEVNASTGAARAIVEETSPTFIYYNRQAEAISGSGRTYRWDSTDGREIIWMSQRDGWAHLYLYDATTGRVKNQITKGDWQVHFVDRVDPEKRQIYFRANGMDAGKDPYFVHHFRINFDGTGLTRFTTADGTHSISPAFNQWSATQEYYVDTYSRVDLPPVSELRKVSDQSLVLTLEKADATDLFATGWKAPEVFTSKARDGKTDIWGIIIRPTNFDPAKRYPVIENIYAGPQGSFVPKSWSTQTGMQTLAELGFIVVQIDGMGTANRSKAFHDVAAKNLGDAGFPDRIIWHKAVAAKYPWYDVSRVGIYGTSAGGQNSMGGVLFHPEFYKAAASSAGCHDNRMDKIWWNEQWMGWPLGQHYVDSSNMEQAHRLQGALLLIVGEMDNNVDPSSTMQVVNKLILANKDFDLLVIPNAQHTGGGAYGDHKRFDFFVRHLQGRIPPPWNNTRLNNAGTAGESVLDAEAMPWVAGEYWH